MTRGYGGIFTAVGLLVINVLKLDLAKISCCEED